MTQIAMDHASIRFRAAAPCVEEGRLFARYLDQAAEGFFQLMLGRRTSNPTTTSPISM